MISYELAKRLKEAGYPQEVYGNYICPHYPGEKFGVLNCQCGKDAKEGLAYVPTLEELIEACGDEFKSLWQTEPDETGQIHWGADVKWDYRKKVMTEGHQVFGDSPIEAVANLWLAVNEKK